MLGISRKSLSYIYLPLLTNTDHAYNMTYLLKHTDGIYFQSPLQSMRYNIHGIASHVSYAVHECQTGLASDLLDADRYQ